MSLSVLLFKGDMERRSGKTGGGGNFRGDMEENLVGVEVRDEGLCIDPFGVCSKYRGLYGVPKGLLNSVG